VWIADGVGDIAGGRGAVDATTETALLSAAISEAGMVDAELLANVLETLADLIQEDADAAMYTARRFAAVLRVLARRHAGQG
jgi:hypothetical protein